MYQNYREKLHVNHFWELKRLKILTRIVSDQLRKSMCKMFDHAETLTKPLRLAWHSFFLSYLLDFIKTNLVLHPLYTITFWNLLSLNAHNHKTYDSLEIIYVQLHKCAMIYKRIRDILRKFNEINQSFRSYSFVNTLRST